mgnify:CR=1 FL=1
MKVIRKPLEKKDIIHSRTDNCCNGAGSGKPNPDGGPT